MNIQRRDKFDSEGHKWADRPIRTVVTKKDTEVKRIFDIFLTIKESEKSKQSYIPVSRLKVLRM